MIEKTYTVDVGPVCLSALLVAPEGDVCGLVQISHGMIEMKERYLPLMRFLAGHGYACQIHDHRGHGKSVRSAADLGYLYEQGHRMLPQDVLEMSNRLRAMYRGKKLCLIGHSMGSLVSLNCLKRYPAAFDAMLLSGCPCANPAVGAGLALVQILKLFRGERARSPLAEKIMFGPYQRRFRPVSPYNWINTDPEEIRLHETDPQMNYAFTLNGYDALLRLLKYAHGPVPFCPKRQDMPVLLLAGEEDPCIGSVNALQDTANRLKRDGYTDVSVKTWPGMRHEVFRAPEKELVFQETLAFLDRVLEDRNEH